MVMKLLDVVRFQCVHHLFSFLLGLILDSSDKLENLKLQSQTLTFILSCITNYNIFFKSCFYIPNVNTPRTSVDINMHYFQNLYINIFSPILSSASSLSLFLSLYRSLLFLNWSLAHLTYLRSD